MLRTARAHPGRGSFRCPLPAGSVKRMPAAQLALIGEPVLIEPSSGPRPALDVERGCPPACSPEVRPDLHTDLLPIALGQSEAAPAQPQPVERRRPAPCSPRGS